MIEDCVEVQGISWVGASMDPFCVQKDGCQGPVGLCLVAATWVVGHKGCALSAP